MSSSISYKKQKTCAYKWTMANDVKKCRKCYGYFRIGFNHSIGGDYNCENCEKPGSFRKVIKSVREPCRCSLRTIEKQLNHFESSF